MGRMKDLVIDKENLKGDLQELLDRNRFYDEETKQYKMQEFKYWTKQDITKLNKTVDKLNILNKFIKQIEMENSKGLEVV